MKGCLLVASKITNEQIIQMNILYLRYKTYAAVAREVGCAPSTVKKYIQPNFVNPEELEIKKFEGELPQCNVDLFKDIENWGELCVLSDKEREDIKELWKEIVI